MQEIYLKMERKKDPTRPSREYHHQIDLITRSSPLNIDELNRLRRELNMEYKNEEAYWCLKIRIQWLRNGDRNTRLYHAAIKKRRAINMIHKLKYAQGKVWFAQRDLGKIVEDYFKKLFTSEDVGIIIKDDDVIFDASTLVSPEENEMLLNPVSKEEVYRAVFAINPHKYPGSEGMNGHFYQQFWDTIGEDVWKMVDMFLRTGEMEQELNRTNICLLPKMP